MNLSNTPCAAHAAAFIRNATAYSRLVKLEHTLFALPFALSALCLASYCGYSAGIKKILLCVAAFACARAAAMGFNRLADIKYDAKNPRTKMRPSVTGEISPKAAAAFTAIFAAGFCACAYFINLACFYLSFPALAVILGYSYAKRFTCAAHYILGLALALAPAGAWIAAADSFDPRILSLSGALFFSIAAFDIIYALQDIDFDRRENLHSIPAALGKNGAIIVAGISFVAAAALFFAAGALFGLGVCYFLCAAIITVLYILGICAVVFGGNSFVNAVFFYINVASGWLGFFGIACQLAL